MKEMSKRYQIAYILILIIIFFLKRPYFNEICQEGGIIPYKILILYSDNLMLNFLWLVPIILNVFIVSKYLYYKLISFDTRYRNRRKYFINIIMNSLKLHIYIASLIILLQWFMCFLTFDIHIEINILLLIIYMKYIIELYLVNIVILIIAMLINNYIYSLIIVLFIILLALQFVNCFYIPFITLYTSYKINFVDILILILLIFIIRRIYINMDLGGIKNESSS